ncbi:hypothetical protein [Kribbella ginsengisoli]|uniref:Uncharacterized protein n=1 Tax=Kribbella ginsengisoli TaxID=363865 RepID=A0ABP6YZE5_9ACTN
MLLPQSVSNAAEPWTATELDRLEELARCNIPPCVIGIRLGRPEIAVAQKAAQAGITLEPANQPPYGKSTAEPNPIQPLGSPEQPDAPAGPDPIRPLGTPEHEEADTPEPDETSPSG